MLTSSFVTIKLISFSSVTFNDTPELFGRLNYEFKCEKNGKIRSWGRFLVSQHFGGRGAC
jgi:hypothetical protein